MTQGSDEPAMGGLTMVTGQITENRWAVAGISPSPEFSRNRSGRLSGLADRSSIGQQVGVRNSCEGSSDSRVGIPGSDV